MQNNYGAPRAALAERQAIKLGNASLLIAIEQSRSYDRRDWLFAGAGDPFYRPLLGAIDICRKRCKKLIPIRGIAALRESDL